VIQSLVPEFKSDQEKITTQALYQEKNAYSHPKEKERIEGGRCGNEEEKMGNQEDIIVSSDEGVKEKIELDTQIYELLTNELKNLKKEVINSKERIKSQQNVVNIGGEKIETEENDEYMEATQMDSGPIVETQEHMIYQEEVIHKTEAGSKACNMGRQTAEETEDRSIKPEPVGASNKGEQNKDSIKADESKNESGKVYKKSESGDKIGFEEKKLEMEREVIRQIRRSRAERKKDKLKKVIEGNRESNITERSSDIKRIATDELQNTDNIKEFFTYLQDQKTNSENEEAVSSAEREREEKKEEEGSGSSEENVTIEMILEENDEREENGLNEIGLKGELEKINEEIGEKELESTGKVSSLYSWYESEDNLEINVKERESSRRVVESRGQELIVEKEEEYYEEEDTKPHLNLIQYVEYRKEEDPSQIVLSPGRALIPKLPVSLPLSESEEEKQSLHNTSNQSEQIPDSPQYPLRIFQTQEELQLKPLMRHFYQIQTKVNYIFL